VLNFEKVNSAFPDGMVPVVALVAQKAAAGFNVAVIPPTDQNTAWLFDKNRWLHYLAPGQHPASADQSHASVYRLQRFCSDNELNEIINQLVIGLVQTTVLAKGVPQAFEWIANELAGNVLVHAETTHGWIQAAVYPANRQLALVVCDTGIGIPSSMRRAFTLPSDLEALELAVKGQVTSKPEFGQGNGLAGSIALALFGGGRFSITSARARLRVEGDTVAARDWYPPFAGTVVDLQLNISRPIVLQQVLWGHEPVNFYETHYEDDKGNLRLRLRDHAPSFGNRITGQRLRTMLENMLLNHPENSVAVDFADISVISSSFADELFGKLAVTLGLLQFGRRVKLANTNPVCYTIIERIVEQRIAYKHATGPDEVEFGTDTD
jgi:hypothetical protein